MTTPAETTTPPAPAPPHPSGVWWRDAASWWRRGLDALRELVATCTPLLVTGGAAALCAGVAVGLWLRARRRRSWAIGGRYIEITPGPDTDPNGGELLWANLAGQLRPAWRLLLFGQPHLAFEIHADTDQLRMGIWVPGPVAPGAIERAVRAAWPDAHTHTRPVAPRPWPTPAPGERIIVATGKIRLGTAEALPLRHDPPGDPLRAVLGAVTHLRPGHTACVQVLARPVTGRRARAAYRSAVRLLSGTPISAADWLRVAARSVLTLPLELLTHPMTTRSRDYHHHNPLARSRAMLHPGLPRAIHDKTNYGVLWAVQVRYAATLTIPDTPRGAGSHPNNHTATSLEEQLRQARRICVGRADTLGAAFATFSGHNRLRRRRLYRRKAMARRHMGRGQIWSVRELAALAHLPTSPRTAGLGRAGAATVAPPPALPTGGADTKPLGVAAVTGRPVALTAEAARCHLHILGQTGTGKSTLIATLALSDITAGRGMTLIDPKGDLARDVLARVPSSARARLVLLDPDQPSPPVLNLLTPRQDAVVEHAIEIFSHVYRGQWGNRCDEAFRVACLTVLAAHEHRAELDPTARAPHIGDVLDLFTSDAVRYRAIATLTGPDHRYLRGYWDAYHRLSPSSQAMLTGPVTNRLRALLLRSGPRKILTGTGPDLDMTRVLDHGGILLARLPEGTLGTDTTRLLGSLLVARAWHTVTARAALPESARPDSALYLDEAQYFLNLPQSLEDLLARARAYRLSLTLAHQHLAQLPAELKAAVATNALTKIFFRAPDDAKELERHLAPYFTAHDVAHLDAYTAAARLHHHGADTPAFTLATLPLASSERQAA